MKRILFCLTTMASVLVMLVATSVFAQRSYDDRIDIAGLLAEAARNFDTAQDVIILSDGQSVTRLENDRYATTIHRILWINSYLAIDECGDVRVPFDQSHCKLSPLAVRTWRDGQWWPSDSSGVVETLPFELEKAYDYAGMREMMLLLSGTGVPCIMEVAYRIEEERSVPGNSEGIWVFARTDPAVESWFEFIAPSGSKPNVAVFGGEATQETSVDQTTGLERTRWLMKGVPAQPDPHSADPAADSPHLVWSTWDGWNDLGQLISKVFSAELSADSPLRAVVDSISVEARTIDEKLKMIAEFVNDRVEYVDYPVVLRGARFRDAGRIYATAYGHRLDRAILACALVRLTGLQAEPLYISKTPAPIEPDIVSLARFDGPSLRIQTEGLVSIYDPTDGNVTSDATLTGRTIWAPSTEEAPSAVEPRPGELNVSVDLTFDTAESKWIGDGFLAADGGLCPFDQMTGLDGEGEEYLATVAESLIEGVSVDDYSLEQFDRNRIVAGFSLKLDSIELDDFKRTVLTIGEPEGGIVGRMPSQAELFRPELRSTIYLSGRLSRTVECRIDTAGYQIVYRPEDFSIKNSAGSFSVTTKTAQGKLVIVRELRLEKTVYAPSDWPALRELLLAETRPRCGQVILKAPADEES